MKSKKQGKEHTFLLSFDVEEFTVPQEQKGSLTKEEREAVFEVGAEGLKKCISILKQHGIVATCFCTAEFVKKYPELIRELYSMNCEIALHGFAHKDHYESMDETTALSLLVKAKQEIEKRVQCKIQGFRGPGFRVPKPVVLEDLGIVYDSSVHPTYIPTKYNHITQSRKVQKYGAIVEIPISVVPVIGLPFSWLWFRNFPLLYAKCCTVLNTATSDFTLLYFHPWEFADLKKQEWGCRGFLWNLTIRNTGKAMEQKLENYIIWAKERGKFKTIISYLHENEIIKNKEYVVR